MTKVYSEALDRTIEVERLIGHIEGEQPGPTLIFTGGIHGNEPSGVFALHQVIHTIREKKIPFTGNLFAISGNLFALERGERYYREDLNRLWTTRRMDALASGTQEIASEDAKQQQEIYNTIRTILDTYPAPFYFMDLHTTSSETVPFLHVNDSLLNRKFTQQYPVPMILGIEEYLEGPLLSYINELGYVAFGYEAGKHNELAAIENNIAFIYLSLVFAGALQKQDFDYSHYYQMLAKTSIDSRSIYEIVYRYAIRPGENFKMKPGFLNFQRVRHRQEVAESNGKAITFPGRGRIFMPMYQDKGSDGFFRIRSIAPVFLRLSAILRKIRFDRILPLLPGVSWANRTRDTLMVNPRIARLFTKQFFHLLGYRSRYIDKDHILMRNRETASRDAEYEGAEWVGQS